MAEEEALGVVAPERGGGLPRAMLDALRDRLEAESVRELHERPDDRVGAPPRPTSWRNIASIFTWSSGSVRIAATDDALEVVEREAYTQAAESLDDEQVEHRAGARPRAATSRVRRAGSTPVSSSSAAIPPTNGVVDQPVRHVDRDVEAVPDLLHSSTRRSASSATTSVSALTSGLLDGLRDELGRRHEPVGASASDEGLRGADRLTGRRRSAGSGRRPARARARFRSRG